MKKFIAILIIFLLIIITAVALKSNLQMHKTFEIQRIIIEKGASH